MPTHLHTQTYRGVTHVHSTYSFDGRQTLPAIKERLVRAGYHFALMSEHVEGMSSHDLRSFQEECMRLTDDRFILVPGLELHSQCISLNGVYRSIDLAGTPEHLIGDCNEQDSFNILVHPSILSLPAPKAIAQSIHAVEVWNAKYDGARCPSLAGINAWKALSREHNLSAISGLDSHGPSDLFPINIQVELKRFSPGALLSTLRDGNFALYHQTNALDLSNLALTTLLNIHATWHLRRFATPFYMYSKGLLPNNITQGLKTWFNGRPCE